MIESKELFKIYCDISQFAEKDGIPKFKTQNNYKDKTIYVEYILII
jgi:hypothetical protein